MSSSSTDPGSGSSTVAASDGPDEGARAGDADGAGTDGATGPAGRSGSGDTSTGASGDRGSSVDAAELAPRPRRQELTAFEVSAIVQEMQLLVGGFLDKAYQPTRNEVLLRFRAKEVGRRDLFIRRGGYACFTEHAPENPTHPPGFAMGLRKHVCGGRVLAVEQHAFDRVLLIDIQRRDGTYRIAVELFGEGNVVLVRPDGRILVPLVPESWAARTIRSGHPYLPPPAQPDPRELDETAFVAKARSGNRDLVRALALQCGLGGPMAEEVALRAGLDKKRPIAEVGDDELRVAFAAWQGLVAGNASGTLRPVVLRENGRPVDAAVDVSERFRAEGAAGPVVPGALDAGTTGEGDASAGDGNGAPASAEAGNTGEGFVMELAESFSAALDQLFLSGRRATERIEHVKAAEEHATRIDRQLRAQREAIERFEAEVGEKAKEGELIFAHYQTVQRIIDNLLGARKQLEWHQIEEKLEAGRKAGNEDATRIVRLRPDAGIVVLRLEDMEGEPHELEVDIRLSVSENADAAYERSKKARDKAAGARQALENTLEKMRDAETRQMAAEEAVDAAMIQTEVEIGNKRHHWFEGFRWFYASTGELVVAGRDATTNDRVVKKYLEDGDRYVHADLHGAPSTVVKPALHATGADAGGDERTDPAHGPDGAISERALEEAAQAAITFSRAFGRFGSGDAYWVTPPQVSKTPQAGEFLARGAFIVRGERNWFRKLPIEAAIGRVLLDADGRPIPPTDDEGSAAGVAFGSAADGVPGAQRPKLMSGPKRAIDTWCHERVVLVPGDGERKRFVQTLARVFGADPDVIDRALPVGDLRIAGVRGIEQSRRAFLAGLAGAEDVGIVAASDDGDDDAEDTA